MIHDLVCYFKSSSCCLHMILNFYSFYNFIERFKDFTLFSVFLLFFWLGVLCIYFARRTILGFVDMFCAHFLEEVLFECNLN
ncbi:unnamed protein product [Lupinus luteus]|uniref:Uncharacterized protein n=1 Tax=Lupinus luteus TaxID=3873 RepID=A0AAV1WAQ9_LUPLU